MPRPRLAVSPSALRAALETSSPETVASAYGISIRTLQRRLREAGPVEPGCELEPSIITADIVMDRLRAGLGAYRSIAPALLPDSLDPHRERIVLASDIHAPYHRQDLLAEIVANEADDTDVLIIGGDISDSFSKSHYVRYKQHFSDREEFAAVRGVLQFLSENFRRVIVLRGNHDERLKKWLMMTLHLTCGEVELLNYLAQTAGALEFNLADPISALAVGLPNVEIAPLVTHGYADYSFFYQHGDLIVSHAERFSIIAGKAADQSARWFRDKAIPMGIVQPFNVLAQSHTHQYAQYYGDGGVWMFETGCLAATPDYDGNPS